MNESNFIDYSAAEQENKSELTKKELFSFDENGRKGSWLSIEKQGHTVEGALYAPEKPNGETIIFVPGMPGDSVVWFEKNDLDTLLEKGYKVFTIRHNGVKTSSDSSGIVNNSTRNDFSSHIGNENLEIDDWLHEPELALECFSDEDATVISHSFGGLAVGASLVNLASEGKGQNISKWINLAGVTYSPEQFKEGDWSYFINNYLGSSCNFENGDKIVEDIKVAIEKLNDELPAAQLPDKLRIVSVNTKNDEYVPVDGGVNLQEKTGMGLAVHDETMPEGFMDKADNQGKMIHDMPNLLPETLIRLVEMTVSKAPHEVTFKRSEPMSKSATEDSAQDDKIEVVGNTNKFYDTEGSEYWTKREPMVMGDLRNRPPMMALVGDIKEHNVLEAGCGTGYVARMLAAKGANVYGCDISKEMLEKAGKEETEHPMGIKYSEGDVTNLPYPDNSMDDIISCGVLIHFDQETIEKALIDAKRVLKKGGYITIGVMHPFLYSPESPNYKAEGKTWGRYTPLEDGKPYEESQKYREDYVDKNGKVFSSEVWHHTIDTYKRLIAESGLKIVEIQEQEIQKEDLISEEWGEDYGYPAFLHIKAVKENDTE